MLFFTQNENYDFMKQYFLKFNILSSDTMKKLK